MGGGQQGAEHRAAAGAEEAATEEGVGAQEGFEVCARRLPLVEWAPALAALGQQQQLQTDDGTESQRETERRKVAGALPFVDILTVDQVTRSA